MFRVAVPGRRDQEASFFTVVVWRGQAEHAAQSLANGSRVVVVGRVVQRAGRTEHYANHSLPSVTMAASPLAI
jgi:single-stranded DNA-binding protein